MDDTNAAQGGMNAANIQQGGADTPQNVANATSVAQPLAQNEYVVALFAILKENGNDTKGLASLINHVSAMESYVTSSEQKIAEMKAQLAEMKEVQNHPVKTALTNAIRALEAKVAAVKEHIGELKTAIIDGARSAVEAFKEKGAAALNNIAKFFHIKSGIKAITRDCDASIKHCDKAVADINNFAAGYHTAGRGIKNMGLVIIGKEPVDQKKENGKLAKALAAPYKAQKTVWVKLKKSLDKAVASLETMEETQGALQAARKAEKAAAKAERDAAPKKASFLKRLDENAERVNREREKLPALDRSKAQEVAV